MGGVGPMVASYHLHRWTLRMPPCVRECSHGPRFASQVITHTRTPVALLARALSKKHIVHKQNEIAHDDDDDDDDTEEKVED